MLRDAGVAVGLVPAEIDERAFDALWQAEGRSPEEIAGLLAEEKARAVSLTNRDALVIGADQTLALGTLRLSKAEDLAQARRNLLGLRGRTHHLHSGVALARNGGIVFRTVASAAMTMRPFSDVFLDRYLAAAGARILSSVGCYQLEAEGIQLFERIEGDYFTILGMPLLPLLAGLRDLGAISS